MTDAQPPLIATADAQLIELAQRWCAALGTSPEVARDVTAARRSWRGASAVIAGEDLADGLVGAGVTRRDHVVIVAREPATCWPVAVELGAAAVCGLFEEDRVLAALASALDGRDEACVVSVVGGSGGAGASTLVAALAVVAGRRGFRSLAFDGDPLGGGLELVLGAERAPGLRWHDFAMTRGRIDAGSLADVLPVHHGTATLSWARDERGPLPESLPAVVTAAVRGFDLVAVDAPRQLDPAGVELVGRSVLTVLLVPEEIAAVMAARTVLERLRRSAPAVGLVTVARRGGIGPGPVAEALDLPVLVRHRHDRRLRSAVDRGQGPAHSRALRRTAAAVLDALGMERP
ncbi:septum site-determining protein Ssd [Aeromicrobium chenweiae]|uniref:Rv3660c-like CheY-like N-terminal domain-containing protein n=1 Tax=Aeromicrobium chenweiae TaxID=2079793 RepID=A0A2S0WI34_9ACTN|nr:septum site-determining protein Ssd [Aeromicrobium chenweiae]AWB90999.1 hypothetical protein C3E78_01500 [Aeromicrobium chenweiae]TGN31903.1 hypothetical protein E4L97_11010 [Aeromicrobium chenweiae]